MNGRFCPPPLHTFQVNLLFNYNDSLALLWFLKIFSLKFKILTTKHTPKQTRNCTKIKMKIPLQLSVHLANVRNIALQQQVSVMEPVQWIPASRPSEPGTSIVCLRDSQSLIIDTMWATRNHRNSVHSVRTFTLDGSASVTYARRTETGFCPSCVRFERTHAGPNGFATFNWGEMGQFRWFLWLLYEIMSILLNISNKKKFKPCWIWNKIYGNFSVPIHPVVANMNKDKVVQLYFICNLFHIYSYLKG